MLGAQLGAEKDACVGVCILASRRESVEQIIILMSIVVIGEEQWRSGGTRQARAVRSSSGVRVAASEQACGCGVWRS